MAIASITCPNPMVSGRNKRRQSQQSSLRSLVESGAILNPDHGKIRETTIANLTGPHGFELERAIQNAADSLLGLQRPDGDWCFELEADCTIPAEYILMMHYMGESDEKLEETGLLPPRPSGTGRWLAPFLRRPLRDQLFRKSLLCAEACWRRSRAAPYGQSPRDHPAPWRSISGQCVHSNHAGGFRADSLACW